MAYRCITTSDGSFSPPTVTEPSPYGDCCWCGEPEFYHYECHVFDVAERIIEQGVIPLFEAIARFSNPHPEAEQ